jgi:hypothetical protein
MPLNFTSLRGASSGCLLHVHQVDLAPVAAGQRQGVGQDAAIAGEAQLIQRRGAVGAEGIGIEEHLAGLPSSWRHSTFWFCRPSFLKK